MTAYAADDDDIQAQRLLVECMSILHSSAVLDRGLLQNALAGSDVQLQPDRVRVTPAALPLEELSKLWTAFQSNFRLSVAYTASVVLVESAPARPVPLPVLRRGADDTGVLTRVGSPTRLVRVYPDVGLPGVFVDARLGDELIVEGVGLSVEHRIRFRHRLAADLELTPLPGGTSSQLRVQLPDPVAHPAALSDWVPGHYMVAAVHTDESGKDLPSEEVPMNLSPLIGVAPSTHAPGDIELTVTCSPQLHAGQTATVVFGDGPAGAGVITTNSGTPDPSQVAITVAAAEAGTYLVRLRVDDVVDSLPVASPPGERLTTTFDTNQQVVVS